MKLSQIPNFRVEDFATEQTWIGKLFIQLNPFIQDINTILSGNIDFLINIKSVTKTYDITAFQPFSFQWPFTNSIPTDLRVIKALKGSDLTPTILQAAWAFDSTSQIINVTRMVELTDSAVLALSGRFQFTIRVTV